MEQLRRSFTGPSTFLNKLLAAGRFLREDKDHRSSEKAQKVLQETIS
jgi:hypothetical protein